MNRDDAFLSYEEIIDLIDGDSKNSAGQDLEFAQRIINALREKLFPIFPPVEVDEQEQIRKECLEIYLNSTLARASIHCRNKMSLTISEARHQVEKWVREKDDND